MSKNKIPKLMPEDLLGTWNIVGKCGVRYPVVVVGCFENALSCVMELGEEGIIMLDGIESMWQEKEKKEEIENGI